MNPGALNALLQRFFYYQLRSVARGLGLPHKGGRQAIIERILDVHADPSCAQDVVHEVEEARKQRDTRQRRRKALHTARNLAEEFDGVALRDPRPAGDEPPAKRECHSPVLLYVPDSMRCSWQSPPWC